MKHLPVRLVALGIFVLSVSVFVSAQAPAPARGAAPPPPTNLQFFPKDIASTDLIAAMQAFN
ncbi:MAG: hypothetical protein EXQ55_06475 [Acidobacteria bacterium]|nr:hypothetical protein [Acidobacteriota bacterium]